MPDFLYDSLTSSGKVRTGVLSAADRADAVRQLQSRGEIATAIREAGDGRAARKGAAPAASAIVRTGPRTNGASAGHRAPRAPRAARPGQASGVTFFSRLDARRRGRPSLSRTDMGTLVRELATAIEAGLPLMQALRTVRRQAPGKAMPAILDYVIERVEAGDPLHLAARDYGPPFDDMTLGMLRAADASGKMSEVLHQLADLIERQVELRREVLGATMYPMIVATLILASIVVLITVLVPRLIAPLAGSMPMPWPTQVLLNVASFFQGSWYFCILAVVLVAVAWRMWVAVPANRMRIDRFKLRMPLLGRLLRDVAVARFTRTLGTLTTAGLPILDALRITQHTLGNAALMAAIDEVQEKVTAGKSLTEPLERCGLFPPLLVQVVGLGERSGRLEGMLMHAATAFDRRVNISVKLFTKALPPLLLVIMAGVGGFVLAAILLPLLEVQSMVG